MPVKLQLQFPDAWEPIFSGIEARCAVLGITISRAEIAKQMMDLGFDAFLARLKAQEDVLPKRPARVWTPEGVLPARESVADLTPTARAGTRAVAISRPRKRSTSK
jgi:hypothetical protein